MVPRYTHVAADLLGGRLDLAAVGHVALVHSDTLCRVSGCDVQ